MSIKYKTVDVTLRASVPISATFEQVGEYVRLSVQAAASTGPSPMNDFDPESLEVRSVKPVPAAEFVEFSLRSEYPKRVDLENVSFVLKARSGQVALVDSHVEEWSEFDLVVSDFKGAQVSVPMTASEVRAVGAGLLEGGGE